MSRKVIPISGDPHWSDYAEYLHPLPSLSPRKDQLWRWGWIETTLLILCVALIASTYFFPELPR